MLVRDPGLETRNCARKGLNAGAVAVLLHLQLPSKRCLSVGGELCLRGHTEVVAGFHTYQRYLHLCFDPWWGQWQVVKARAVGASRSTLSTRTSSFLQRPPPLHNITHNEISGSPHR